MLKADYRRSTGKQLTYQIEADAWGWFTIWRDGEMKLKGHDPLSAHGTHRVPGKRKQAGALATAQEAIESLREMDEE